MPFWKEKYSSITTVLTEIYLQQKEEGRTMKDRKDRKMKKPCLPGCASKVCSTTSEGYSLSPKRPKHNEKKKNWKKKIKKFWNWIRPRKETQLFYLYQIQYFVSSL